jgi:hypothetical protein
VTPYLEGPLRAVFDAWLEDTRRRYQGHLTFSEVRKGVQALSSLYVERRSGGHLGARATAGEGKRAAFACYYAPLHFLTAHHALARLGAGGFRGVRVVHDLGCGTGATGIAAATLLPSRTTCRAVDLSSWALAEAALSARAFGLTLRTRRAALPAALPRAGPEDLLALGWVVNELLPDSRERLLRGIEAQLEHGARLLVLEPFALSATPWWPEWSKRLTVHGVEDEALRLPLELPAWIQEMDQACGLDHRELRARALLGPLGTEQDRTSSRVRSNPPPVQT